MGEPDGLLDLALIRRACAEGVAESDRLEWKGSYPLSDTRSQEQRVHEQAEMAKDLAAMANGSGGLVLYGVEEDRQTDASCASNIKSVGPVDERKVRTLKQVASNLIYPPVVGLDVRVLDELDTSDVVVAVSVPASPDSPHLIRPKNSDLFGVPWRNGSDTEWMVERQIESAYRARFDQRRQRDADLTHLFDETVSAYTDSAPWLVVVASPVQPRSSRQRMDKTTASYIFGTAWARTAPAPPAISPAWMLSGAEVRAGLRRFRQSTTPGNAGPGRVRGLAEVHNDGSVVFAMTRGGFYGPQDNDPFVGPTLGDTDIDDACEALFHLLWMTTQQLGINSDYTLKLAVLPADSTFRRRNYRGGFDHVKAQDQTSKFLPVLSDVPITLGRDQTAEAIVDVARDARHQLNSDTILDASSLGLAIDLDD
ncbi:AlbA family DNA-binding domain-containing protein [Aeromicrobium sp. Root495]|uniref:AlbA family DNA-binding domain-containing protein n=1 Tax=Aeromicrobium sp. Root495 TaxID=1736550 RepID=UPI001F19EE5D|nr:ATP-binding protein [Aeromicrobium sp. Root495]